MVPVTAMAAHAAQYASFFRRLQQIANISSTKRLDGNIIPTYNMSREE